MTARLIRRYERRRQAWLDATGHLQPSLMFQGPEWQLVYEARIALFRAGVWSLRAERGRP